jgi:anti-sigma regulatory factor (Ser/Thr protein kinase)
MSTASETANRSLTLKCSCGEVERLHQFLRDTVLDLLGKQAGEVLISTIILAVHEAFTNVIRHAYVDAKKEDVLIRCTTERKGITVEIIDQGVEFNPFEILKALNTNTIDEIQNVEDLNELDEHRIIGGHGIPIILAAATSTDYRRSESNDNHLYLYFQTKQ